MAVDYKVLRVPAEEIGELSDFEAWLNLQGADDWDISHISPNRVITFVKGAGGGSGGNANIAPGSSDKSLLTWNDSLSAWESTYVLDDSLSASSTTVWTSERITQLVENEVIGLFDYKGGYNASTNTPDIIGVGNNEKGDVYTVEVGGTFLGETVESGDMIIAEIDDATVRADFTLVQKNVDVFTETENGLVPAPNTTFETNLRSTGWDAPDLGGIPYPYPSDFAYLHSKDGSYTYLNNGELVIGAPDGSNIKVALGISIELDENENPWDIETTINGEQYSLIDGNSDSMGLPDDSGQSYPVVQNFGFSNLGAVASPMILQGRRL